MSAEQRKRIYIASLLELERSAVDGRFSAFQAALHSGDAVATTTSPEQKARNAAAISSHQTRLDWLAGHGLLYANKQHWDRAVNAAPEDCLTLYCLTSRALQEIG